MAAGINGRKQWWNWLSVSGNVDSSYWAGCHPEVELEPGVVTQQRQRESNNRGGERLKIADNGRGMRRCGMARNPVTNPIPARTRYHVRFSLTYPNKLIAINIIYGIKPEARPGELMKRAN